MDRREKAKGDGMTRAIVGALMVCALVVAGAAWGAPMKSSSGIVLKIGKTRSFARTELRPGTTVRCTFRGHSLSVVAPTGVQEGNGVVWPGGQAGRFFLDVIGKPGGAYAVTCGLGFSPLAI
jgi:hypothetical protein